MSAHPSSGPEPERALPRIGIDLQVRKAGTADVALIRELAGRSWHAFYPGMISMPQIHYMLRQMYSPRRLQADLLRGARYFVAETGDRPIGFLGCDPTPEPTHASGQPLVLQRFYLVPEFQGRGYGAVLLGWLEEHARGLGLDRIRLRVNKHNHRALRAYRRAGYRLVDALIEDIGEGHVMDDYVLERRVAGSPEWRRPGAGP